MPCQCLLGKSPAFIARDEMLTDEALDLYAELASPGWTSDDASPEDLAEAVDAIKRHWGQHPSGDYSEACDWCAHIVSERALEADGLVPADLTSREADAERAAMRREPETDPDEADAMRDIVVSLFAALESDDWSPADCYPGDLEGAVDSYRAEIGEDCSEDYADACEIAGALFDSLYPTDDLCFMVETVVDRRMQHRNWEANKLRSYQPEGDSCPVICLDSYRRSGAMVTL